MHSSGRTQRRQPVQQVTVPDESPEPGDNFGILPHDHTDKQHSEPLGGRKRELRDHERGIGSTLKLHPKRMPMQAAPDHGDMSNADNDNAPDSQSTGADVATSRIRNAFAAFPQGQAAFPNNSTPKPSGWSLNRILQEISGPKPAC